MSYVSELNVKDPAVHFRVDIGFPVLPLSKTNELFKRLDILKKNHKDMNLEKLSREKKRNECQMRLNDQCLFLLYF